MASGRPPSSSRPSRVELDRLETTRGAVRDALSAIGNLHELLRSIRVGPKAVSAVLPDVRSASRSLVDFTRELLDSVGKHLNDRSCVVALVDYLTPPVSTLETAISEAMETQMTAGPRLSLEQVVHRCARDIAAALGLVTLLEEAVAGETTSVALADLVRQSLSGRPDAYGSDEADVILAVPAVSPDVTLNARAATRLIAIGAALAAPTAAGAPCISVENRTGAAVVCVRPTGRPGERWSTRLPRVIPCSVVCAEAAAMILGASFELSSDRSAVTITFPGMTPDAVEKQA